MKALILNSGVGHRMGGLTADKPKGMTDIGGGYTILSRQLTQLSRLGVRDVVITTGPFPELLRAHVAELLLPLSVEYVHSPVYASTNYIMSMHLAAPHLIGQDVLLCHGDLVMETSVLRALLESPVSVMAVDSSLPLPAKDFKAKLRNGAIVAHRGGTVRSGLRGLPTRLLLARVRFHPMAGGYRYLRAPGRNPGIRRKRLQRRGWRHTACTAGVGRPALRRD